MFCGRGQKSALCVAFGVAKSALCVAFGVAKSALCVAFGVANSAFCSCRSSFWAVGGIKIRYMLLCCFLKPALCVAVSPCKLCPLVLQEFFLGSGGVFGLLQALVGEVLPGAARCVAVGNALLQGPVVFHFPQHVVARIKERALEGDPDVMQLLVDLYRWGHSCHVPVLSITSVSHKKAVSIQA